MENEMLTLEKKVVRITSVELVDIINQFRELEFNLLKEKGLNKKDKYTELRHDSFMAKIKKELETLKSLGLGADQNILEGSYADKNGQQRPCFSLNRDGMLQMLNSESAIVRAKTIKYIDKLEEQLNGKANLLLSIYEGGQNAIIASKQLAELEKKPLLDKIEKDKPKVTFADSIIESSDTIDISKLAKLVKDEDIPLGRNKLFEWLRNEGYLMKDNDPYQKYIDMKIFEIKEYTYKTPYGTKLGTKTLVTPKGQIYIIEKLKDKFLNID